MIDQAKLGRDPSFLVHADNSSSLRSLEDGTVFNAVRIGLLQFGIASPRGSLLGGLQVEPVLSFHSKLAMIKELPKGTSLSYDRQYTLKRNSKIGIISAGYGDAIPLHCGNRSCGLIKGQSFPLVGRVTMDQTLIDLTDSDREFQLGEKITLVGNQGDREILLSTLAERRQRPFPGSFSAR